MKDNFVQAIKGKTRTNFRRRRDLIFYISLFALPCIQFCVFYIGVNVNSLVQAFMKYDLDMKGLHSSFAGFENFSVAFDLFKSNLHTFKYSFIAYATGLCISFPLSLIFSFYIYKKMPASGVFKVFLFMPQLVSGLVFSLLFNYIVTDVYIELMKKITGESEIVGLLYNRDTRLGTVLFFNVWVSFGVNILLFSGGMSAIDESIVESAQLDGVGLVTEFLHITIPLVYPTIMQMLIVGVAGIFANQMQLMSLYGLMATEASEMATFGMFLYINMQKAKVTMENGVSIGVLSSMGLMLTLVLLPTTMIIRKLLAKLGPSVN